MAHIMKTKRQTMKKSTSKKLLKKGSVGRPRKSERKKKISKLKSIHSKAPVNIPVKRASLALEMSVENVQLPLVTTPLKSDSNKSEAKMCSSSSKKKAIVHQPPIAKSTCEILRSVLLSADRIRFNSLLRNTNFTPTDNDVYNNNYYPTKWKKVCKNPIVTVNDIDSSLPQKKYVPDIQSFPDVAQLADVDVNASLMSEQDTSSYSINDYTDTDTLLCVDGSDTISDHSIEMTQEQRDFDQQWGDLSVHLENVEVTTTLENCETILNSFDDNSLFGPQDTDCTQVHNDIIQNYIETNDVQSMQLPDSGCEVIRTLQYYESRLSPTTSTPRSFPEHSAQNDQFTTASSSHTLVENMFPCPIANCLWYSHSASLYVHLLTSHHNMISFGSSITHVFKCQDIQNYCFFTHLQYVQNTIFIITVAFDCFSHSFVASIQHISSCGDNTSVSQTIARLTTSSQNKSDEDQHSWSGPIPPYCVPLDVLHADGRCLLADPDDSDQVVINVNLTMPLMYSNDSMYACL